MKYSFLLVLFFSLITFSHAGALKDPIILPTPQKMVISGNSCTIKKLKNLKRTYDKNMPEEGYKLVITRKGVIITSSTDRGFVYAKQTLYLLQQQYSKEGKVPCLVVEDAPRVKWRSLLMDSGRQFQRPETIKKYIDLISLLKFNVFHWHLTEGMGWRIEIKKYPLLTSIGSNVLDMPETRGYYSQAIIKDIVNYANSKGITVMPEIDVPGHSEAALNAYPELSCFKKKPIIPVPSPTRRGFTADIFCAGKDTTISFLKNVIDEVCELFPSEYIHIGGDEAPKANWKECPHCQKRIKDLGVKDENELQIWFSETLANHLQTKGRKAVIWGDGVVGNDTRPLPKNLVIHWWSWRSDKDREYKKAIESGLPVINGTNYYTYLNFPVTPWSGYKEDRTFDIRDVYEKNPSFIINPDPLSIGMSAALWTDYNVTEDMIDKRLLPRIFAIAQQMWYKEQPLPFDKFYAQLKELKPLFEALKYEFGPGLREEVPANYSWD